jgi:hypothetical protein
VSGILLVAYGEYPQCRASYWSHMENILSVGHPIGHIWRVSSVLGILLVIYGEYSQCGTSYWSHMENILSVGHPIGHIWRIFSVWGILLVIGKVEGSMSYHTIFSRSHILLVPFKEYPQWLLSYWTCLENILSGWHLIGHIFSVASILMVANILSVGHPTGHVWRIFSVSGILLVTYGEYSQSRASYWSRMKNILSVGHPIGHIWRIFLSVGHPIGHIWRIFLSVGHPIGRIWRIFLSVGHPIGRIWRISSVSGILLVAYGEYPQYGASYWLHMESILSVGHPIGHIWRIFSVWGILLVTTGGRSPVHWRAAHVHPRAVRAESD